MRRKRSVFGSLWDMLRAVEASYPGLADQTRQLRERALRFLQSLVLHMPETKETKHPDPVGRSEEIIHAAARRAATVSGSLALPPGPLGLVTLLPDLLMVWRIQAQMVADVAGAFGERAALNVEHLKRCLFRHAASQVARDVVVRAGQRVIVRQGTSGLLGRVMQRVSMPLVGTVTVAAYAFADTVQVGRAAIDLFREESMRNWTDRVNRDGIECNR